MTKQKDVMKLEGTDKNTTTGFLNNYIMYFNYIMYLTEYFRKANQDLDITRL